MWKEETLSVFGTLLPRIQGNSTDHCGPNRLWLTTDKAHSRETEKLFIFFGHFPREGSTRFRLSFSGCEREREGDTLHTLVGHFSFPALARPVRMGWTLLLDLLIQLLSTSFDNLFDRSFSQTSIIAALLDIFWPFWEARYTFWSSVGG